MSPSSTVIATPATIRGRHLRRTPGLLVAERGRVEFRSADARVFSASLAEIDAVAWPWWWFGTRLVITVRGERYRITFGQTDDLRSDADPVGTADTDAGLLDLGIVLFRAAAGLGDRLGLRSAVRPWRELLNLRPQPSCHRRRRAPGR